MNYDMKKENKLIDRSYIAIKVTEIRQKCIAVNLSKFYKKLQSFLDTTLRTYILHSFRKCKENFESIFKPSEAERPFSYLGSSNACFHEQ